jgi:hypothetical protein
MYMSAVGQLEESRISTSVANLQCVGTRITSEVNEMHFLGAGILSSKVRDEARILRVCHYGGAQQQKMNFSMVADFFCRCCIFNLIHNVTDGRTWVPRSGDLNLLPGR